MVDETAITERVERAVERDVELTVARTDPLVIEAHSEHSDRIHTLVPNALHCSCEDDTYRGPVCYHLIALALQDDWRGATMREVIGDEFQQVQDELSEVQERYEQLRSEAEALQTVRRELGDRTDPQPTEPENVRSDEERMQEAVEVAEEMAEAAEEGGAVSDETADGFRQMVESISSGNE